MKQKIGFAIGMLLILTLIFSSPWSDQRSSGGFTEILNQWSQEQEETSDKFTAEVVSGVEGKYVGQHRDDGSNWAIPNIIRKWLGVID